MICLKEEQVTHKEMMQSTDSITAPSYGKIERVLKKVKIPVNVMIRPR
jgi:copper homeostasis protein CutC